MKHVIRESGSYIKDSGDFLKKVKHLGQLPDGAILVTADVVGLYPSIPHKAGLQTLRRRLNERETSELPNDDIVQMSEFFRKRNFLSSMGRLKDKNQAHELVPDLQLLTLAFSWNGIC